MSLLYIFNPEHDLCLANGDRNFVPPVSALHFAQSGTNVMRVLYGDNAPVIAADNYALWQKKNPDTSVHKIIPWGWDLRLKQTLLKQGADPTLLPDDSCLADLKALQHRSTALPLQPHASRASSVDMVRQFLLTHTRIVAKAPWSGAGRGVRWIDGALSAHDEQWLARIINTQGCVMVEKRLDVVYDFAIEFKVENGNLWFVGSHWVYPNAGSDEKLRVQTKAIQLTGFEPGCIERRMTKDIRENRTIEIVTVDREIGVVIRRIDRPES